MHTFFTWFFITMKRQFHNPVLFILLLLIPFICACSYFMEESTNDTYNVGIYSAGTDELSRELTDTLLNEKSSMMFTEYKDIGKLYTDVQNGSIISGVILSENFADLMATDNYTNAIHTIYQPSSTIQAAINEIIYSCLIKIQGKKIITDYADSTGLFDSSDEKHYELLTKYYEAYINGNETFHIDYETVGKTGIQDVEPYAKVTFPFRGILSILVFLSVLYGVFLWLKDCDAGIFVIYSKKCRMLSRILYAVIPGLLFGLSAAIGISVSTGFQAFGTEITGMIFLVITSSLFAIILSIIIHNNRTYLSCIPLILLCCLIFCPVFIVTSNYLPAAKYIERLLVPYYYLRFFG